MKSSPEVVALVPATSINPDGVPEWPHIKLRAPVTQRLRMTGSDAGTVSFDVHAFARGREESGAVVETGEDHAGRIGAAIELAFSDNRITLEGGGIAKITWSDARLLEDESPDAYHYFAQVNARVLAA